MTAFKRVIVTPEVSTHRVFAWLNTSIVPDKNLVVVTRDDDTAFGILQSRFHEVWALRMGTSLVSIPRYTPSTTFDTFAFPEGLMSTAEQKPATGQRKILPLWSGRKCGLSRGKRPGIRAFDIAGGCLGALAREGQSVRVWGQALALRCFARL